MHWNAYLRLTVTVAEMLDPPDFLGPVELFGRCTADDSGIMCFAPFLNDFSHFNPPDDLITFVITPFVFDDMLPLTCEMIHMLNKF